MNRTEWFPAEIKPVHIGPYEVQNMYGLEHPNLFNYWSGKRWTGGAMRIDDLVMYENPKAFAMQDRVWRGLTEPA